MKYGGRGTQREQMLVFMSTFFLFLFKILPFLRALQENVNSSLSLWPFPSFPLPLESLTCGILKHFPPPCLSFFFLSFFLFLLIIYFSFLNESLIDRYVLIVKLKNLQCSRSDNFQVRLHRIEDGYIKLTEKS